MSDDKTPPGGKPETSWTSGLQPPDPQTPRQQTPRQQASARGTEEEGGFLRRWSRRKGAQGKTAKKSAEPALQELQGDAAEPSGTLEVELSPETPVRGRMITSPPGGAPTANDGKNAAQDETDLEEADLPDVEEMDAESDFTPFLKKGVSEQLQRKALRKLWLSDPVLANVDGLLDYGDDFTDAAMVVENMKTVYTVGRGMVPEPEEPETPLAEESPGEDLVAQDPVLQEGDAEEGQEEGEADGAEGQAAEEITTDQTRPITDRSGPADQRIAQDLAQEQPTGIEAKTKTEKS